MEKREVIAYAITHAPRGQKGGPYESWRWRFGTATGSLEEAARCASREEADPILESVRKIHPNARVIRIVRKARPSPSEAGEVLRELVAWDEGHPLGEHDIVDIAHRARRVLAAAGPDPSEVVRAVLKWAEGGRTRSEGAELLGALSGAVDAYRKAGGK